MMNCAEICQTSANFQLSSSKFSHRLCEVCAEVCEACVADCEKIGGMDECVEACENAPQVAEKWQALITKYGLGSMDIHPRRSLLVAAAIALTACSEVAQLPVAAGTGPHPQLPPPNPTLIPTVNIAQAVGWPANGKPEAAPGMTVNAFAEGLEHPRWLYVLPNGDVLVAETNAPPKPEDGAGFKGWLMKRILDKAGAGVPSANRITLLRDTDGDGVAETRSVFIEGLNSPFGMALVGNEFYVANSDALVWFPYSEGENRIVQPGTKVLDLPAGPINHHWTKNLIASQDGSRLYVTVGSNSNVAENGIEQEVGRAAIWEVDPKRGSYRIWASGLRNPNGLAWEPDSGALWTVVNERDEIGSDLVPDYLTSVADGDFSVGLTVTMDSIWISECSLNDRIWSPRQKYPTMRWDRTPRRSAWLFPETPHGRRHSTTGFSSASTVRGIVSRVAVTE
jgi:Glucose/sorbosone dehydrogenases